MTSITLESPVYQIGEILFSPTSGVINNGEEQLVLRAREANLLTALIDSFPEVLSRADIEAKLWKDSYATNATINQTIKALRFSLKDDTRTLIRTIPKHGYVLSRVPKVIPQESSAEVTTNTAACIIEAPLENKARNETLSSKLMFGLLCLFFLAFGIGYWQAIPPSNERISHQYEGNWFLSNSIPLHTKEAITADNQHHTNYVLKVNDDNEYRVCHLMNEIMKCETVKY
ncbi:winged helix-turn-helix domain-containing protein [Vibrio agarivorans]|uniref:Winged helix-turn-helix domain-containing protein n=1 Tax=Vibrio agarivorans TaxID=153622 RepID=A0ABT7XWQ9_9VIBR|nr:winged helix-turn-helix domain-containing protein [Vibrio agarivorans]MDN2480213.1 winged helix-turn-helix domain-containing protein [Vibrio agarivorans]